MTDELTERDKWMYLQGFAAGRIAGGEMTPQEALNSQGSSLVQQAPKPTESGPLYGGVWLTAEDADTVGNACAFEARYLTKHAESTLGDMGVTAVIVEDERLAALLREGEAS